jgi:hypothetical protein
MLVEFSNTLIRVRIMELTGMEIDSTQLCFLTAQERMGFYADI